MLSGLVNRAAGLLAFLAGLWVLGQVTFLPLYQTATFDGGRGSATLWEVNGVHPVTVLFFAVMTTASATGLYGAIVWHRTRSRARAWMAGGAILLWAGFVLAGFTVGPFYFPAALCLTLAARLPARAEKPKAEPSV